MATSLLGTPSQPVQVALLPPHTPHASTETEALRETDAMELMRCKGFWLSKYTATSNVLPALRAANGGQSALRVGDCMDSKPLTPAVGRGDENWSWRDGSSGIDTTIQASMPAHKMSKMRGLQQSRRGREHPQLSCWQTGKSIGASKSSRHTCRTCKKMQLDT